MDLAEIVIKPEKDLVVRKKAKLLVIDNYDSFTYNLVQMFPRSCFDIIVKRSDEITLDQAEALDPDFILISPGPKDPAHAGISMAVVERFHTRKPILGVCLGMQCINEVFGGSTERAALPVHGKTSRITHGGRGIFQGMPSPFSAARYHSLVIKTRKGRLVETAWSSTGIVMGLEHPEYPLFGVQFHPESFLTDSGERLINNFLNSSGQRRW
ncbi:MAG TPA: aminodeoxychorismate/anthranilate synthase component II [Desulfobacteraceae bacterium]|nr:aminodeoxychorismate/anthranilate synthase component II [Desulfobacteraceae bacterium]